MMNEAEIETKLNQLMAEIGASPSPQSEKLLSLTKQTAEFHKELKTTVNSLQESIDYLKIVFKYQLFDLEATRRENGRLRKLLEERGG
jgi:hypothetical protein